MDISEELAEVVDHRVSPDEVVNPYPINAPHQHVVITGGLTQSLPGSQDIPVYRTLVIGLVVGLVNVILIAHIKLIDLS